ncbi:NAD(P)H-dependent oxidoreductase [Breoghania sp. JC706]|uniref:NAD(P)H-dependent oxidoreductase n=1 Tax=Breoghania sp. JC706 TaxID=3117732 RepID=UPI00300BF622
MTHRIVLIQGHPDPDPGHLCHALGRAYAEGAREAGHEITEIAVAFLAFPILRNETEYSGPVPEGLQQALEAIQTADHIVIVFPLWLGTLPALTKAFFEQILHRHIAFEDAAGPHGFPRARLGGRSARLVTTMSMPSLLYRFWYRAHGLKWFERNALNLAGIAPVRKTLFGGATSVDDTTRAKWLEKMRELGREVY